MKKHFVDHKFSAESQTRIITINSIIAEYAAAGYDLSLRQLYYQLVSRALVENTNQSYKRLGKLVTSARLAGLIDWSMIRDRGREVITPPTWDSPKDILEQTARAYTIDKWANQDNYPIVIVEKDALSGVLGPVCDDLQIPFFAAKGYPSISSVYFLARRLRLQALGLEKNVIILHLGDHDPSGIDMTRDLIDRIRLLSELEIIEINRLALNIDQIQRYKPPPNPAKMTDSRAGVYVAKFGRTSWELDALDPVTLADLVRNAVADLRDQDLWEVMVEREEEERSAIAEFAQTFDG